MYLYVFFDKFEVNHYTFFMGNINSIQSLETSKKNLSLGVVENFFNSQEYTDLPKEDKIKLLSYIVENRWSEKDKAFLSQIVEYFIEKSGGDVTVLDWQINLPFWDDNLPATWDLLIKQIIQKIYDDTNIQNEVIRADLEKTKNIEQKKQAFWLYKLKKIFWWSSFEEQKDDIKKLQFVLLGWTHWDEIGAFSGFKKAKELFKDKKDAKASFHIVNPIAVENETRNSDEDINRVNTIWSHAWLRKTELKEQVRNRESEQYFVDFHNCNGKAKLGCVSNNNLKHKLIAGAMWLDALIVYKDLELAKGTVVDFLTKNNNADSMIIEVGKDVDVWGETTMHVASELLKVVENISCDSNTSDVNLEDVKKIIGNENIVLPIEIEVSIIRNENGEPIKATWPGTIPDAIQNMIDKDDIPEYCIQGKWDFFIKIQKKNGDNLTFPSEEEYKNTIGSM